MLLNISLALAATGGVMIQPSLNYGRTGRLGSNISALGIIIAFAALIAAFFVMTWWWVLIGLLVIALIGGKLMATLGDNSFFVGMFMIAVAVVLLIVHLIIR